MTKDAIFVDGVMLDEPYVFIDEAGYTYPIVPKSVFYKNETLVEMIGEYYEFVVPENELFVMGDHRNRSTDSRDIGTIRKDSVLGKVILRLHPFDAFGIVE